MDNTKFSEELQDKLLFALMAFGGQPIDSWAIAYRGKPYTQPMRREKAEGMLHRLKGCCNGLELVEVEG
jgi:hypothetical protein